MALSEDMKAYRDAAREQGKRAIDQAQAVLSDLADEANKRAAQAQERGQSLMTGVRSIDRDKVIDMARTDLEVFLSAFEPYVGEAKRLRDALVDRAEHIVTDARKDPRVAKAYDNAEALAETVVTTVNERMVAPALSFVRRSTADNGEPESQPPTGTAATTGPAASPAAAARSPEEASGQKPTPATTGAEKAARQTTARKGAATNRASSETGTKSTAAQGTTAKASPAKRTAAKGTAAKGTAAKRTPAKRTPAKQTAFERTAATSSDGSTS
jgi:hypothetical protein